MKLDKLDRDVLQQCDLDEPRPMVGLLLEHARRLAAASLLERLPGCETTFQTNDAGRQALETGEARVFGTLTWKDAKRGGDRAQHGDLRELARKLRTLRAPATLRADGREEEIGGCEQTGGRWRAWYDRELCE